MGVNMWQCGKGAEGGEGKVAFSNIHLTLVENGHFAIGPCN